MHCDGSCLTDQNSAPQKQAIDMFNWLILLTMMDRLWSNAVDDDQPCMVGVYDCTSDAYSLIVSSKAVTDFALSLITANLWSGDLPSIFDWKCLLEKDGVTGKIVQQHLKGMFNNHNIITIHNDLLGIKSAFEFKISWSSCLCKTLSKSICSVHLTKLKSFFLQRCCTNTASLGRKWHQSSTRR